MKRRRIISGAICASTLIVALEEPAAADRWRHAPADSAYLHITTSSQYDPSDSISGAVRRGPRGDERSKFFRKPTTLPSGPMRTATL